MKILSLLLKNFLFVALSLLTSTVVLADAAPRNGVSVKAMVAPELAAQEFYVWYLKQLVANQDPLSDQPAILSKYVSRPLIKDIRRKLASVDGMSADYFIQAQDYLEGWLGAVSATSINLQDQSSNVLVTLGRTTDDVYRLNLKMVLEDGQWKIRTVTRRGP